MSKQSSSLRDMVVPGVSTRADFPLSPRSCALLIIDIQTYLANPPLVNAEEKAFYGDESFPSAVSNIRKLAQAFRVIRDDPDALPGSRTGCEVIFTFLQACTKDGRDISLDYKLSGPLLAGIPRVDCPMENLFLENCKPDQFTGRGDILLPKTSCSVFSSTNLDYILRNLIVEQLVICGQLTDQCIESAVRDAADLGYLVTVAEDACAARSFSSHMKALHSMKGFCRILETAQLMDEIMESLADELRAGSTSTGEKKQPEKQEETQSPPALSDEAVLSYLRTKKMDAAADELGKIFQANKVKNLVFKTEKKKPIIPDAADELSKIFSSEKSKNALQKEKKKKSSKEKV